MEQVKFRAIATHVRPHFDELVAIWLLGWFGEEKFPGSSDAEVIYWGSGGTPDGRSSEEYEKEGVLPIGVGGGRFDEHPTTAKERTAGECAATLVAKALGVYEDPALGQILKEVVTDDLKGGGSRFGMPAIIQLLHQQYPDNPEKVMDWAMMALDAKYREQTDFHIHAKREFQTKAKVETVSFRGVRGERHTLKLVTIVSDNEQIGKFARSERGCQAAVVIQQWTSGNVMIFSNHSIESYRSNKGKPYLPDFSAVAEALRATEIRKKGGCFPKEPELLSGEGKVAGAEEWFYQKGGEMLLNGSSTAPNVPPTKIPLPEIAAIVKNYAVFF